MTAPPPLDVVTIGELRLRAPASWELLSSRDAAERVWRLARQSPDWTLYHAPSYLDFARKHGGPCAMLVAQRAGELLFGLPVHSRGPYGITTGSSGVLLPDDDKERSLRRSVAAMFELLSLNPELQTVQLVQSAQSARAREPDRWARLDAAITCAAPPESVQPQFTRVLALEPPAEPLARTTGRLELAAMDLDAQLLKGYDGDLRNQIRQGERHGLGLVVHVLAPGAELRDIEAAYSPYLPVHAESWERTGMQPHSAAYWHDLSAAVVAAGGVDLVVLATVDDLPVAGVTCHLLGQEAIYWSGASLAAALPKRANPFCLHGAISLCRRLGVRRFELGRFTAWQDEKSDSITRYKAQFGGSVTRVPNVHVDRRTPPGAIRRLGGLVRAAIQDPSAAVAKLRSLYPRG